MTQALDLSLRCAPLGDGLILTSAWVREALSEPTTARVSWLSAEDIDVAPAIGEQAVLEVLVDGDVARRFRLVVVGARFEGIDAGRMRRYSLELANELQLLALRSDVRMFQEQDAQEIVESVLEQAGFPPDHARFALRRALAKRTYCVQYRETDFAFLSRLVEHEGIFYVVEEGEDETVVAFADDQSAFGPIDGATVIPLIDDGQGAGVHELVMETVAGPRRASIGDYNAEQPKLDLVASADVALGVGGDRFEFPAGHRTPDEGAALAELRAAEHVSQQTVGRGVSDQLAFRAGASFELEGASREALSTKYLLRSVEHEIHVRPREVARADAYYRNRFTCMPFATPYRPPRRTPRARVWGVHSAVVTGPSGSEIHTDRLGRMKGRFFWDRAGKDDDTSSCWMRVVQLPIGGSMALARAGWEMSVAYLDGDPDRPVVVSRLYNAEKVSPYPQPGAKARSAMQTASSPGGGKTNEIRLDDSGGSMEFFINASKDLASQTNNNKTEKVGVDEKVKVGSSSSVTVGANETVSIGASQSSTIGSDADLAISADRTKTVGASESVTVGGAITTVVSGSDTELTGGSHTTLAALGVERTAVGSHALTVGGSMINAAALGVSFALAGAKSETIGGSQLSISGGTVGESVIGALATTVGGVVVQAAAANRAGSAKGSSAVTVGGLAGANAAGKLMLKAKTISIRVAGVANLLGGGGILTLTPGSASFVGLVGLDASSGVKISGNPNLVG